MVEIKEIHYEKKNPSNRQERIIKYSSWEDYIKDIQIIDGTIKQNPRYPSIPRQTQIYNLKIKNKYIITFELIMRVNHMKVIGVSELL